MTTLAALASADQAAFVATLDGIYEHSPWVAARAWAARPFAALADLHAAMAGAVAAAAPAEQLALVRAHPRLAARVALTPLSHGEQRGAGLDRCAPEELAALTQLNGAYAERFGFPFVIAVRGHTPASVIAAMRQRLDRAPDEELAEALRQIDRIALLRLQERVRET